MATILAIDQGTTSTRAILFDAQMRIITSASKAFVQHFPANGWVEHDPEDLWETTLTTCRQALTQAQIWADEIAAIGITNQRETSIVWDRATGVPIAPAIVWQDRRTAGHCRELADQGYGDAVTATTGLLLDPYFSATKIAWMLDNVEGARARAKAGELAFGTVDSFLIWRLTGGTRHVTDATNAARTSLYDIHSGDWSAEMCEIFNVPRDMLPEVLDCANNFGTTDPKVFGAAVPITGVAGDQQAATIGQACFEPGMMKSTYGTGCFALMNTGTTAVQSRNQLLTTIAYRLDGQVTYALEGSIFVAGAVVQWMRDGLGIIEDAPQTANMAEAADTDQHLIIVPAFTGLGAPYWNAECRGAVFGLTRNSGPKEFARAALQSVGFQTRDLLEAMQADVPSISQSGALRVDGGMAASDWTMQFLADMTARPVERPPSIETTALGAAWLAGSFIGLYPDQSKFAENWSVDRAFVPSMDKDERDMGYERWKRAVAATMAV
jgi:glycerol kinase